MKKNSGASSSQQRPPTVGTLSLRSSISATQRSDVSTEEGSKGVNTAQEIENVSVVQDVAADAMPTGQYPLPYPRRMKSTINTSIRSQSENTSGKTVDLTSTASHIEDLGSANSNADRLEGGSGESSHN